MIITREWMERRLRAAYQILGEPLPDDWPLVVRMWVSSLKGVSPDRAEDAIGRIMGRAESIADLKPKWVRIEAGAGPESRGIENVIRVVGDLTNTTRHELLGQRRDRRIARPRQVAMLLARDIVGKSTSVIGDYMGRRDHTTVMHGCRRIEALMETDGDIAALVREASTRLRA